MKHDHNNSCTNVDIYKYSSDKSTKEVLSFKEKLQNGTYIIKSFPCPICNNANQWCPLLFAAEGFRWSICRQCGLFQVDHRLTQSNLNEFYESGEYTEICTAGLAGETRFMRNKKSASTFIGVLMNLGYDFSQLKILDIGCGAGGILLAMKELGATVQGYDLDPQKIQYGRNFLQEIEVGDALAFDKDISQYNFILLTNVLEHLFSPMEFLVKLNKRILNYSTQVFIDVPNLEGMHDYSHNAANNHLLEFVHIGHLWYFTSVSLERLLNQAGFQVNYIHNRGVAMTVLCSKSKNVINNNSNSFILSLSSIDYANYKFNTKQNKDSSIAVNC